MSKYSDRARGFEAGQNKNVRPDFLGDEHLKYLDELRESGETNMFSAMPYLMAEFPELSDEEAATVLSHWMRTFSARHRKDAT